MGQETDDVNERILFIAGLVFFFRKGTAAESDLIETKTVWIHLDWEKTLMRKFES